MDIWGLGCVFFEVLSLFPLFPGNNELDQIHKIHNILGTPPKEILDYFQKFSSQMDFKFPSKEGTGISKLIPHVSKECKEFITKLLAYNPDDRPTARQALNSSYMKDLKAQEKFAQQIIQFPQNYNVNNDDNSYDESTQKKSNPSIGLGIQAMANNSMGMKKIQQEKQKANQKMLLFPKYQVDKNNSSSEEEEQNSSLSNIITSQLPPIIKQQLPTKVKPNINMNEYKNLMKQTYSNNFLPGGRKVFIIQGISLKKINDHKKNYISPYSIKAIQKNIN